MALQFFSAKASLLPRIFSPLTTAIFSTLPLSHRWRLLLLQPINILAALLTAPTWLFNNHSSVIYIPTRTGKRRCIVFYPPRSAKEKDSVSEELRPLHIDIHGGGWIGGFPEQDARFCSLLSERTGAVVVSISYRIAPRYIYPTAHDDVDDAVTWLLSHAETFGADRGLLTIGGSGVGGGLALSASQHLQKGYCMEEVPVPLAYVGICPALDFRIPPFAKPRPRNFPTADPLSFLLPLYDVYAGTNREQHLEDPRLHPILTGKESLPRDVLLIAAGIDILLAEAVEFFERMKKEEVEVEFVVVEKGFHGFVELPSFILEKERLEIFEKCVYFLKSAHRKAGFDIDKVKHL